MQPKTQHRPDPWSGDKAHRTSADALFSPPSPAKTGHALESPSSKIGSVLLLLAISSVAAVGVFMPEESAALRTAPAIAVTGVPRDAPRQAYALAYDLARERVKTVEGLTRIQRLQATREAVAQVLGVDVSHLGAEETAQIAKQAPKAVKDAAFRGMLAGEAKAISAQSQQILNRILQQEKHQ